MGEPQVILDAATGSGKSISVLLQRADSLTRRMPPDIVPIGGDGRI